jgi:hypothetical protein
MFERFSVPSIYPNVGERSMCSIDPEIIQLENEIFRSKVMRARRMSFSEKFALGAQLFDENMAVMRGAIRSDHPDFTDDQIEDEVIRRLAIARKLEDGDLYRDAGVLDE